MCAYVRVCVCVCVSVTVTVAAAVAVAVVVAAAVVAAQRWWWWWWCVCVCVWVGGWVLPRGPSPSSVRLSLVKVDIPCGCPGGVQAGMVGHVYEWPP
jgi:hypothetical protein